MALSGDDALALAKSYVKKTAEGLGAVKGKDGFSPIVTEDPTNTKTDYRLDVTTESNSFKTPNLKGSSGEDGFSPTITENPENNESTYRLVITNKGGSFTTPNLKGKDGASGGGGAVGSDMAWYPTVSVGGEISWEKSETDVPPIPTNIKGTPGDHGFSPVITENPDNTDSVYKLDITTADGEFTTPNLKGEDGSATGGGEPGKSAYEIAVEKGFIGTESEWLESLKGEPGEPGRSITNIQTDENGNVTVTFSDGTTKNIGKLAIDVSADFLTSGGFGNLRYINGKFQCLNKASGTWIDTSVSPQNPVIINMTPQPMEFIFGVYDHTSGHYKLKWKEPKDTILDGQTACVVEKVVIARKSGGEPANVEDGAIVATVNRSDFGAHENVWYVDESLSPQMGDTWHYKAFPYSTMGFYGNSPMNDTGGITAKDYALYGFKIDQNESDPESMITYIEENAGYRPAHMDYENDIFEYGDWESAFFMKVKPCMLKYDGTVDYFLDPNDYAKKEDGSPSDVANESYGGNAMVQFPKTYWKITDNGDDTANVYISDTKVDNDYVCWSHIDNNGDEIPYCYMPIYNGCNVNNVLRSLSGKTPMESQTVQAEVNYAKANNQDENVIWYTEVTADRQFVNLLLLLIGKSTDTQTVFGSGNNSGGQGDVKTTGTMDKKGLFWGNQDNVSGVKVFGMEHYWGNLWHRIAGWINDHGTQKVKLTYGKSDGSTANGYNFDGAGYIMIPNSTPQGTSGGYISKVLFTESGLIPTTASGSATTYFADGLWFNNGQVSYALVGGASVHGLLIGALCVHLYAAVSLAAWVFGASISCKPLA